jgi:Protein of unknown function (DUF3040)
MLRTGGGFRDGSCSCAAADDGPATEAPTMSLSAWEQQTLDSIKDGLVGSDPQLAALLTTFTRLASGEEMPAREEIPAGSRRAIPRPRRKPRHRRFGYPSLQWVMLLLFLVITGAVIAVAVILNHGGGQGTCTGSWPTFCTHSAAG